MFRSLLLITLFTSCASFNKKLNFEQFNQINVFNKYIPLNEKEMLVITRLPSDEYRRLYKMDLTSKELELVFDAEQSISSMKMDKLNKFVYLAIDNAGDEQYKLYQFDLKTKKSRKIFGKDDRRTMLLESNPTADKLLIVSNYVNKAIYLPYIFDLKTMKISKPLYNASFGSYNIVYDWKTKDIYFSRGQDNATSILYKVSKKTKRPIKLYSAPTTKYSAAYLKDGYLFLNTSHKRDRVGCAKISIKNLKSIQWVRYKKDRDQYCFYDKAENLSYIWMSMNGRSTNKVFWGHFGKEVQLTDGSGKELISEASLIPKTKSFIVKKHPLGKPAEIYKWSKGNYTQLTQLNQSGLSYNDMADTEDFYYKSYDGKQIHSILVTKKDWKKSEKKRPVIIWPHGGPDWYSGHEYYPYFQYYTLSGFIVLAPNYRGSTSFGKSFEKLNDMDWGGGHIKDLVWAKKALKDIPYADTSNVFIAGRSFGGYSTLAAITYHPNEFKAAVAIVAIGDLFEFLKTIPPSEGWQREFRSEVGDPKKDKKLIYERSPFFHAENVTIPLKVYHTENDTRTRIENMNKYVAKLKSLKKEVDYELIKGEGHAPKKKETWEKLLSGTVEFFNSKIQ